MKPTRDAVILAAVLALTLAVAGGGVLAAANTNADAGDRNDDFERNDDMEPNDDFDEAATIDAGTVYGGLVTNAEDDDVYAIDLERGDRLDVAVRFAQSDGDIDLHVFDPNRDRIASALSSTDDENVTVRAKTTGTYYVYVAGFSETETQYSLEATQSAGELPSNDEFEYNDGLSSATEIPTPFERAELRLAEDDSDFYAVEVGPNRQLNATIGFDNEEADVELTLYDSDGELVTTDISDGDNETVSTTTDGGGVYYVGVISTEGHSGAWYNLTVFESETTDEGTTERSTTATTQPTTDPPATTTTPATTSATDETEPPSDTTTARDPGPTDEEPGFGATVALAALALVTLLGIRRRT